ncbi:unnamed protein product [Adineta steineri]|uniref:Uncharacterized protein n=1 Tax=Adineta steineri TaxID=433720 RepID=A0A820LV19_9BILA|nr:unnamed protein product [Adineta steineri]
MDASKGIAELRIELGKEERRSVELEQKREEDFYNYMKDMKKLEEKGEELDEMRKIVDELIMNEKGAIDRCEDNSKT